MVRLPATTAHSGGVDTNEQGAVFHPLNGSGAKGTTGRSNASRRKQKGYPKVPHPRDTIAVQIQRPVVTYLPKISTGLPFLFRSPEPLFLLPDKRKSGFGPRRAGKNQLQDKNIPLSRKRKSSFTRKEYTSAVRRPSRATSAHPFRKPPTQAAWIPTNVLQYSTHSTAVAQGGPRVAQTQAAGNRKDTPKSFTRGTT